MRIAVVNETSAADKNKDILAALEGRGHQVINAGMTKTGAAPELTYINTGLLSALLLNAGRVDLVVGGCGTGQGYLNSVMQYPNVCCGLIQNPLDAWLFGQINLKFIFDRLFSLEQFGLGYPPHRQQSQQQSRKILAGVSVATHKPMAEIVSSLDDVVIDPVLSYPGFQKLLDVDSIDDKALKAALKSRM